MSLNKNERMLAEAISTMLQQDAELGLSQHEETDFDSAERGYEYLHNQIDEMFLLKSAELVHSNGVNQAFKKVHNYKYVDDPTFIKAMNKEMLAQGIPADEREKAKDYVTKIIDELKEDQKEWSEQDMGFSPMLDEIKDVSNPEINNEMEMIEVDGWDNKSNVEID